MNKRDTIAAIGQKTRLRNHDIQKVVETLLEVWSEELATGGRIEIQNFLVFETSVQQRNGELGTLTSGGRVLNVPTKRTQLRVRASKYLRARLREGKMSRKE